MTRHHYYRQRRRRFPQRWLRALMLIAAVGLCGSLARAVPIPITNPGFEDITGETPFNEFTFGELNGWSLYDPGTVTDSGDGPTYFIGTLTPFEPDPGGNPGVFEFFPAGAAEGMRVGIAFNFDGSGDGGEYGMEQTLVGQPLQPNTKYTLQVEIGNIATGTSINNDDFPLDGFPGYRVELLAGGVMIAQDNNSLAGLIPEGTFATSSFNFTTGDSHAQFDQDLGIRLVNLNSTAGVPDGNDLEVDFDNVRLDAVSVAGIPEPGTLTLLCLAVPWLLWSRRWTYKQSL